MFLEEEKTTELVSIVVPAYNEEKTIEAVLKSFLNQTIKSEIIVVDDGSTDGTKELISRYPVKLISTERKGPGHARNLGAKNAKGNIIAFIDADETIDPNFIEVTLNYFKNPCIVGVYPAEHFISRESFWAECLSLHQNITQPTVHTVPKVVRKSFFLQVGGYDEGLPRLQDEDLRRRMIKEAREKALLMIKEPNVATYHIEDAKNLREVFKHSILFGRTMTRFTKKHKLIGTYGIVVTAGVCLAPLSALLLFVPLPIYLHYLFAFHFLSFVARHFYLVLRGLAMTKNFFISLCLPLLDITKAYGYGFGILKYALSRGKIL